MSLLPSDGPLVWIDCEMTGLRPTDTIIEIACIITTGDLTPVDDGIHYVIRTEKEVLEGMNEWCVRVHGASGLTQACLDSPYSYEEVAGKVLEYVKRWIPKPRVGVIAGNSVHGDAKKLKEGMPELMEHLHYRIVDVSTIKELARRWYPEEAVRSAEMCHHRGPQSEHRAMDDIKASILELKAYRESIFLSRDEYIKKVQKAPRQTVERRESVPVRMREDTGSGGSAGAGGQGGGKGSDGR